MLSEEVMMVFRKKEPKILVVDDDIMLADNLVEYLTRLGHHAVAVYGGHEALDRFENEDFQLVVTDLMMPEMDGMELLEVIKALDSRIIVMVVTGYGTIDSAVTAMEKGAFDFIPKPFKMEELEVIISRALDRHTLFRRLSIFRRLTVVLLISIPFWLAIGIMLALIWK